MKYELEAFTLYRQEVFSLSRLDWGEIEEVAEQARLGDKRSREIIIERCLAYVIKLAFRYRVYLPHDGCEDIAGIGNLAIIECLDKALSKEKPIAYLMRCAQWRILTYVNRRSSLIERPESWSHISMVTLEEVQDSLEDEGKHNHCLLSEEQEEKLYDAIQRLTPLQMEAVLSKHQLLGRYGDTLYKLSKRTGKDIRIYMLALKRAHVNLRRYLELL